MRTLRAFDFRLFAYTLDPFMGACGSIPGFPGLAALKAPWINIVATAEERPEECDLVLRGRTMMDELGSIDQWNFLAVLSICCPVQDCRQVSYVRERLVVRN